ncbi:MAG: PilW family protein [Aquabacterium sp.]|uniref:PilW family protein n=1 Tax=Aquabacterium sp. TaxID=1872578 RepID=UPI00271FCA7A|nr:PilW family protein [Aquabacterium sp.]MDO9003306.1 PilW family protein [Aquabacterium sp.]
MNTPIRLIPMARQGRSQGISLIELLISMVIGLVVVGVTFTNYLNSGRGRSSSAALGQMAEDANVALNFMRKQISLAGYSEPFRTNDTVGLERKYTGRSVFGCNDALFAALQIPTIGQLSCGAAAANSDAIAVAYEATRDNAIVNADTNRPRDCIGSGVAPTAAAGIAPNIVPAYFLAESRIYIANNTLMCQGNGQGNLPTAGSATSPAVPLTTPPQPLVDNIESLRITYGLSGMVKIDPLHAGEMHIAGRTPVQFVDASAVGDNTSTSWDNVVAVRVCIVVRSESEVMDSVTPYYGCDAIDSAATTPATTTPPDRRLYRAFSTTIMVQNRLGAPVPVSGTTPVSTPPVSGTTP